MRAGRAVAPPPGTAALLPRPRARQRCGPPPGTAASGHRPPGRDERIVILANSEPSDVLAIGTALAELTLG